MIKFERQYDLFNNNDENFLETNHLEDININEKVIKEWQQKIIYHQSPLLKQGYRKANQPSLFKSNSEELNETFNPLDLTPLALSFGSGKSQYIKVLQFIS